MSAARQLQVPEPTEITSAESSGVFPISTSQPPPTPEAIGAKQLAEASRRRRRKTATVMVFTLLASATGLSLVTLSAIAAKIVAGAIGGVVLGAIAVAPSGRIDG